MKNYIHNQYTKLESSLGYSFRNKDTLATALMHSSFKFESQTIKQDNQRLEFLGDAVLSLIVSDYLMKKFPAFAEGKLTTLRTQFTSGKALAMIGKKIDLGDQLKLGKGERRSGGDKRASNIEDAMEAIMGAAYLDGGLKAVNKIFLKLFVPMVEISPESSLKINPKGRLQEITQRKWGMNPVYHVLSEKGLPHSKTFVVEVLINSKPAGKGKGSSKREAEEVAASMAIEKLQEQGSIP